jgi:hypothetical protein
MTTAIGIFVAIMACLAVLCIGMLALGVAVLAYEAVGDLVRRWIMRR